MLLAGFLKLLDAAIYRFGELMQDNPALCHAWPPSMGGPDNTIAGFFPRLDTTCKRFNIVESPGLQLLCPTGRRGFVGSSAVKNDFSIPGYDVKLGQQLLQGYRPL
jgi:hypothetical protein